MCVLGYFVTSTRLGDKKMKMRFFRFVTIYLLIARNMYGTSNMFINNTAYTPSSEIGDSSKPVKVFMFHLLSRNKKYKE